MLASVLVSQSKDELISELKRLNHQLDSIHENRKVQYPSTSVTNQIADIKNQIYIIKKKLETSATNLDNPVYFDNDIYLDQNLDLLDFYVYELSENYHEVNARLKNKRRQYLSWVKLRYNFYSNGSFVGTDYSYIDFESYEYIGMSPYKCTFIETMIDITDYDSIAYQIEYDIDNGQDHILGDQILILESVILRHFSASLYDWEGVVSNNYNYSLEFPKIFACILKNDKMIDVDYTYLDVQNYTLPANSSAVFDAIIDLPSDYDEIKYYLTYSLSSLNGSGNLPPNIPIFVNNLYTGLTRKNINFDIFVIDPNDESIKIFADFGDDSVMNWEGNFISGYNATIQHPYLSDGQFQIKAKSKDGSNIETEWSEIVITDISLSTPPEIVQTDLDTAYFKNNCSFQLRASNGISPYSWQVTNGFLPDGLNLHSNSGIISGLPTKSGSYNFTISVNDAGTPSLSDTGSFNIFVVNHCPAITSDDTINTSTNSPFMYVPSATDPDNNSLEYDFIDYPSWLTKNSTTLFGTTPDSSMDTSFSVIATDGELNDTLKVILIVTEQTSLQDKIILPESYSLYSNYPNPFNSSTNIKVGIPKPTELSIVIYDITGHVVDTIYKGKLEAGYYTFKWNGMNHPSGIYFCRFKAGDFSKTEKLVLYK